MNILKTFYGGTTSDKHTGPIYPLEVGSNSGEKVDLDRYAGNVLLIVNTASKCGFTGQYASLERLYQDFRGRGFVVLGFPSNDFGQQEPGSDQDIQAFCSLNHGVTFPLFTKGSVKGAEVQPLFSRLTNDGPVDLRGAVRWNFEKFLISRKGELVGRWRSYVSPQSTSIQRAIERELAAS